MQTDCGDVFSQVLKGRCAGDEENVGGALKEPGQGGLHRGGADFAGAFVEG